MIRVTSSKAKGGDDTLSFDGTEGDDAINIFAEPQGTTGNLQIVVEVNGVRSGVIQDLDVSLIENIGIRGLGGDDVITVDFGDLALAGVKVDAGPGDDYVSAADLKSTATLIGGAGNDTLIGGLNDDVLEGDAGDDVLRGGPGADTIDGGAGNDSLYGDDGGDWLYGGLGHDYLEGGSDNGDDHLYGGAGEDYLIAGDGDDYIMGGADDDVIDSGLGNDVALSGTDTGNDQYDVEGNINWLDLVTAVGTEFRVNTYTLYSQTDPSIAVAADGSFVVTWTRSSITGDGYYDVYAQRYSDSGQPVGGEFLVNTYTTDMQYDPSIAMAPDGSFFITWDSFGDGDRFGVCAQRYDNLGQAVGDEFRVNTYVTHEQWMSSIAMAPDGSFVITWESYGQDGDDYGVYAQRYNASGQPIGDEFRVNTYTTGSQSKPSIAMAPDGSFVITWSSSDGSSSGVYAQCYNASGQPIGGEFRVNTYTTDSQSWPSIAIAADGRFVIAWTSYGQDGGNNGVYAQRYEASAQPLGGEFRVNTYTTGSQSYPWIAMAADGSFVIAWESSGQDGSEDGIYAQRYNASCQPVGGEFRVNTYTTGAQSYPSIAMAPDGDFVIAWTSYGQDGSGPGIYAQVFDAAPPTVVDQHSVESARDEFRVNTYTQNDQRMSSIAMAPDGSFVVAWQSWYQDGSDDGIYAQRYNAAGEPVGSEFRVNTYTLGYQSAPSIAMASDGSFVIAWQSDGQDGSENGVYAQRYNAAGEPVGSEFCVNTYTEGDQYGPSIAMAPDGSFVVAWQSWYQDGSEDGVYAQRYNAAGEPVGSEFRVNTYTEGDQSAHSIAMAPDGSFVVAWQSYRLDDSPNWIYAQRYNGAGEPVGSEFRVNTYTEDHQFTPSIAMAADGSFVVAWISSREDDSEDGVYAQWYNGAGEPVGSEFCVNTNTEGYQSAPSVAMAPDGRFVVVWQRYFQDSGSYGVYAQRYNAVGQPFGRGFRVDTRAEYPQPLPSIAMAPDGSVVITWENDGQDGSCRGVYAQRYNAPPSMVVDWTGVNTALAWVVSFSEVLAETGAGNVTSVDNWQLLRNGVPAEASGICIVGISQNVDPRTQRSDVVLSFSSPLTPGDYELIANGSITDVAGRQLDGNADGVSGDDYVERFTIVPAPLPLGPEITVAASSTSSLQSPILAVSPLDQSYVAVWQGPGSQPNESDIYAQRFDAQGTPLGEAVCVNTYRLDDQADPTIAMDADGNYVIVWDTVGPYSTGHVTYARRFFADGTPIDAQQFPINVQSSSTSTRPSVAMDDDGNFVVAWQTDTFTGDGYEVVAQRFTSDALAIGAPIRVNSQSPSGDQWTPDVAMDALGNFLVTWNSVDGEASEVMARWFSAAGVADDEFRVNTTTAGNQDQPRAAMNPSGEFAVVWRSLSGSDADIYAQRYDSQCRPIGGEFPVNASTTGAQELPDLAIDEDGNLLVVWSDGNPTGSGYTARWFDKWGNRLADEFRVSDVQGVALLEASVNMTPDGESVIAWLAADGSGGSTILVQHYTLLPPTVLDVALGETGDCIVVAFSQPMATTGVGSVLSTANWALRLPDGRYIIQDDPNNSDDDWLATPEQFGTISLAFNTTLNRWEATIPLNFTLQHGEYQLTVRGSLCNATGRQLDGDADGTSGGDYAADVLVETVAPVVTVDSLTTNDPSPALHGTVDDPTATVQVTVAGQTYSAANDGAGQWMLAENAISPSLLHGVYDVTVVATDTVGNVGTGSAAVVIDRAAPTVTIHRATDQSETTTTAPIGFIVVFSEAVTDFTADDVTLSGTAGATTVTVTGSGTTYDVAVSGMTHSGTVVVSLAAGVAHDAVGNANLASASADNTVVYDLLVSLAVSPTSVLEDGTANLVYTFTRTGDTVDPLTVTFNVSGTATYGADYSQTGAATFSGSTGTVTFEAGASTATVTIDPTADTTVEPDETVLLTLASGIGYTLDTPSDASGTILNDDTASLSLAGGTVFEGDSGTTDFLFTISLTYPVDVPITVTFSTADGTAMAPTDYTAQSDVVLTIPAYTTLLTQHVLVQTDTRVEPDEVFSGTIGNLSAAGRSVALGAVTAQAVILNDDEPAAIADLDVEVQGVLQTLPVAGYSVQDELTQDIWVEDDGQTLCFIGNAWKQATLNYTVTTNTILEFDFQSNVQGEIQGIGFDTDEVASPETCFQLYGTQTWGIQAYRDYASSAGSLKHYVIPVGEFFTGSLSRWSSWATMMRTPWQRMPSATCASTSPTGTSRRRGRQTPTW